MYIYMYLYIYIYIYVFICIYILTYTYLGKKRGRPFTSRENTPRGEKGADKGAGEKGARIGIYVYISIMYLYDIFIIYGFFI
jgi:hypothetical protein